MKTMSGEQSAIYPHDLAAVRRTRSQSASCWRVTASGKLEHETLLLVYGCVDLESIEQEERLHRCVGHTLDCHQETGD
jgi:hypothetical protein